MDEISGIEELVVKARSRLGLNGTVRRRRQLSVT
jgi:hypothetical protein